MSRLVKDLLIALLVLVALGVTVLGEAEAAAPAVLKDTVCPGKPTTLSRKGTSIKLAIDRAAFTQDGAVLRLQRDNRKDETYLLHATGERMIAVPGVVLRLKPSTDKGNCFEVL